MLQAGTNKRNTSSCNNFSKIHNTEKGQLFVLDILMNTPRKPDSKATNRVVGGWLLNGSINKSIGLVWGIFSHGRGPTCSQSSGRCKLCWEGKVDSCPIGSAHTGLWGAFKTPGSL